MESDKIEKIATYVLAPLGVIAILINLFIVKGFTVEGGLDALKDLAGLAVTFTVFFIAIKIFRKGINFDFVAEFESNLKDWINQNDYLVCDNFDEEGKGKYKKRYCLMIIDHSNLVTAKKTAKAATINKEKGAFVYLPYKDDDGKIREEFEFRFNERTFERQNIFKTEEGKPDLKAIIEKFSSRIETTFRELNITVKANPSNKTITVYFKEMDHSKENAKKLVDMVEFVKTMVLALA